MKNTKRILIALPVIGTIGYLVPLYFGNIWLGLGILLLTATMFIAFLLGDSRQYFESKRAYLFFTGIVLVLVVFHAIRFSVDYGKRDFQKNLLLEIRKTLEEGIATNEVQGDMFYALRNYHSGEYDSIVLSAKDVFKDRIEADGVLLSKFDLRENSDPNYVIDEDADDEADLFYEFDEAADVMKVIVVANIPPGENLDFQNYNGNTGRFEMEFTLTKEGVSYEVAN